MPEMIEENPHGGDADQNANEAVANCSQIDSVLTGSDSRDRADEQASARALPGTGHGFVVVRQLAGQRGHRRHSLRARHQDQSEKQPHRRYSAFAPAGRTLGAVCR